MEYLNELSKIEGFMPQSHYLLWSPGLLWLNVVSDTVIALVYFTIPATIIYFIKKRPDLPFNWMFGAFGAFFLACGSMHLLDIWTIWQPAYGLLGFAKAITAVAAILTAALLIKFVPIALLIPSHQQLAKVNEDLVIASRHAGMAEVATNVLHNVGNVLNSVNVSANLVAERVQQTKNSGLAKVVALLREHEHDLGAFISNDAKGKHLPDYLAQLSEHLETEQEAIAKELSSLQNNINHIKSIVALQQSYAKQSEVKETINIIDVLENSISMNIDALNNHSVQIVREFDDVPQLTMDKHKVLDLLTNLIANAKHACAESGHNDKQLTLRVTESDDFIKISVIDNGMGILPQNITKIFNHGFTTRKDGHGFGLHSGAIAAQELGGSLSAQSDGEGQGATFILKLPLNNKKARLI